MRGVRQVTIAKTARVWRAHGARDQLLPALNRASTSPITLEISNEAIIRGQGDLEHSAALGLHIVCPIRGKREDVITV